jgi:hypothetical protein
MVTILRPFLGLTLIVSSRADSASEWAELQNNYGNLMHVAGTATGRQANFWQPGFEGGSALAAELSNPHMAVADAAGNIYIADKESHSILKVTPAGTIHTAAGTHVAGDNGDGPALQRQLRSPNGVFCLADGTFYIIEGLSSATVENFKIRRVGLDGQMTTVINDPAACLGGRALWVSPDEQLIYYPSRDSSGVACIKRWTPAGGSQVFSSGFISIGNITVDRSGSLIVTEDTGNRVARLDGNGLQTVIAGNGSTSGGGDGFPATSTGLDRVRGVACLPNGAYLLATQKGSHIWYVDSFGIMHKMIDCNSSANPVYNAGNGQHWATPVPEFFKMNEPRAITVAPNGDIIITASDHGQIRVIKCVNPPAPPSGARIEQVTSTTRRLRWSGLPWQSYFIEHSPTITSPAWQVIGLRASVPGGETLHPLPDTGSSLQGYYRLRMPR